MQQQAWPSQILRKAIVRLVQREDPELTTLQFAVLLICNEESGPHTVRGLAARLNVAKPAITRAVDRLVQFNLARRVDDPQDRRSVHIAGTGTGLTFLAGLGADTEAA